MVLSLAKGRPTQPITVPPGVEVLMFIENTPGALMDEVACVQVRKRLSLAR